MRLVYKETADNAVSFLYEKEAEMGTPKKVFFQVQKKIIPNKKHMEK